VGQPLGTASRTLQDAGFKLGNVTMAPVAASAALPGAGPSIVAAPPQPSPASIVAAQTPPAGQKVFAGAVLNFEVK